MDFIEGKDCIFSKKIIFGNTITTKMEALLTKYYKLKVM